MNIFLSKKTKGGVIAISALLLLFVFSSGLYYTITEGFKLEWNFANLGLTIGTTGLIAIPVIIKLVF